MENRIKLEKWRVDIIQTKENQEVKVKEHKGVELHSFESVGAYFQEMPTSVSPSNATGTTTKNRDDFKYKDKND